MWCWARRRRALWTGANGMAYKGAGSDLTSLVMDRGEVHYSVTCRERGILSGVGRVHVIGGCTALNSHSVAECLGIND
jgi:hypothetical protein